MEKGFYIQYAPLQEVDTLGNFVAFSQKNLAGNGKTLCKRDLISDFPTFLAKMRHITDAFYVSVTRNFDGLKSEYYPFFPQECPVRFF